MAPPLLSLRDVAIRFGERPLFEALDLTLARGERLALVGRNGSGKSTLLKLAAGLLEPDAGERHLQQGCRSAYLSQAPDAEGFATVSDYVAGGGAAVHLAEKWLDAFGLDGGIAPSALSGGEMRRAQLARALAPEPDLLLLDEPTNHLDLAAIERLEDVLAAFGGGLILVSHDRALLTRIATGVLWLDRGRIRRKEGGFAGFEAWSETLMRQEAEARHKLNRLIAEETRWSHEGITARRRRNQGRLRRLAELRRQRAQAVAPTGEAKLEARSGRLSGRLVIEAEDIAKSYGGRAVIRPVSLRVLRGDRIAIVGPNGAGKTTLLRMLIGELEPDAGTVRLGTNLDRVYLDQQRATLDPEKSLWETLAERGGDQILVQGRPRHVVAYLRDFLFAESQARSPVSSLSGGERNRLLLARALAQPANLLVLDEPTNDLDLETLDLLQEMLAEFDGTVLLVSHDRDFIDRVATATVAIELGGRAREYPGGYSDYLRQRPRPAPTTEAKYEAPRQANPPSPSAARLGYKQRRALEELPKRMQALQSEIAELERALADPGLFARDPEGFRGRAGRLAAGRQELSQAEEDWLELEMLREAIEGRAPSERGR